MESEFGPPRSPRLTALDSGPMGRVDGGREMGRFFRQAKAHQTPGSRTTRRKATSAILAPELPRGLPAGPDRSARPPIGPRHLAAFPLGHPPLILRTPSAGRDLAPPRSNSRAGRGDARPRGKQPNTARECRSLSPDLCVGRAVVPDRATYNCARLSDEDLRR